jgi:hypothetical protein
MSILTSILMSISLAPRVAAALALGVVADPAKAVSTAAEQPALIGDGSPMSLNNRLDALQQRHASLEDRILDEDHRPLPDAEALARLKIEKLQLKDEMERIRISLH